MVLLMTISVASCDDKSTGTTNTVIYGTSTSSVLVQKFSLKSNEKVLKGLDSVYFSIDQDRMVIYNADSLPMGTDVSKLLVALTFGTNVSSANFVVSGGKVIKDEKTIKYSDTSTDSIDFTGNVTLNVTSQDGATSRSYRVMVNVHQTEADSLMFPLTERRDLPAAADENYSVGMAQFDGQYYSLVHNSNGRYVATAATPSGKWTCQASALPFVPAENSLAATTDALYVLDVDGNLYQSADGQSWTSTGNVWRSIIGAYGDRVLGIASVDGTLCTDEYPRRSGRTPEALPQGFPVTGMSQLIVESSNWAVNKTALMVGGRDAAGNVISATWGYDGDSWAVVSQEGSEIPALEGATLFSYYTYDLNVYTHHATPKVTWVVLGGRRADGKYNRTTYLSRNMGLTWMLGSSCVQVPEYMPSMSGAKAFVLSETRKLAPAQRITKPVTEWDVPYVYIVGGEDINGKLLNNVWKGAILRMTFKPIN